MANIKLAGSVIPSTVDTPLDARSRVAAESDILTIANPAVGQLVYCTGTGKFYVVKTLTSKTIGALVVQNAAVGTYEEFSPELSETAKTELLDELENILLSGEWGTEA